MTTAKPPHCIRCDKQWIAPEAIVWLEGDVNYTRIHQYNQPTKMSARTLKWYESILAGFIRVRRGAMVNPAHIRAISRDEDCPNKVNLLLSNGEALEVARRRVAEVRRQFKQHS